MFVSDHSAHCDNISDSIYILIHPCGCPYVIECDHNPGAAHKVHNNSYWCETLSKDQAANHTPSTKALKNKFSKTHGVPVYVDAAATSARQIKITNADADNVATTPELIKGHQRSSTYQSLMWLQDSSVVRP